jgi:hypothetical protein
MTLRKNANLQARQYDVLADGVVVGRIMKAKAAPVDAPWMWSHAPPSSSPAPRRSGVLFFGRLFLCDCTHIRNAAPAHTRGLGAIGWRRPCWSSERCLLLESRLLA